MKLFQCYLSTEALGQQMQVLFVATKVEKKKASITLYTLVQSVLDDNSIILLNFADIFFCEGLDFYLK